jgi:CRP/FNR family cyclic AMP-dependent transcriptional regulator
LALLDDPLFSKIVPFERTVYQKQNVILKEDTGQDVYLILQGEVQVRSKIASENTPFSGLARLGENDVFGELAAVFDGESQSAEVIALADCEIARIDGPNLIRFMDEYPEKGYFLLREIFMNHLVRHLRQNNIRTKTVLQL